MTDVRAAVTLSRARRRWMGSVFATVPSTSPHRTGLDALRVVVAAAGVLVLLRSAPTLSPLDTLVLEGVGFLPGWLLATLEVAYWALLVGPVAAVVVVALVGRRWRLLTTVGAALLASAVAGVLVHAAYDAPPVDVITGAGLPWSGGDPSAPVATLAVAGAVVLAAGPFLVRPSRRLALAALWGAAVCSLGGPVSLPSAVLATLAMVWGAVSLVHLVVGAPEGGPSTSDVQAALAEMGLTVDDVRRLPAPAVGQCAFLAASASASGSGPASASGSGPAGALAVTVLSRDATRDQFLRTLAHRAWYKEAGPSPALTRLAAVEHRALLLVLADRAGVPVPQLLAAGTAGPRDDAVLVTSGPAGVPLDGLDPAAVDDRLLDDMWSVAGRLHAAGLAHGDLQAANLVVTEEGSAALRGFSRAGTAPVGDVVVPDDVALLVTTAAVVGVDRAVAAARRALGDDGLATIVPALQPAALPPAVRRAVPDRKALLTSLRERIAAQLGVEPPQLEELRRVSPGTLFMAIGGLVGVYLLAGQLSSVGGLRSVLRGAEPWWVAVAAALSQLPQLAQAVAMLGSVVERIPLGSATAVQFANQFMGLVGGTVATTALIVRYFQRLGLGVAVAVSSGVINTVAVMITQTILVAAGILLTRGDWRLPGTTASETGTSSGGSNLLLVAVAVLAVLAVVLVLPRLRRAVVDRLRPHVAAATQNLREVSRQPSKALQLFGGNTASQLLFAMTLGASLLAFGGSLPLMQLLVINSFASLLGGIMPVPGGLGVVEAGLIAGLTAAGVPQAEATAATFLHRTLTAYLPPIWGWASLRWLQRKEYV